MWLRPVARHEARTQSFESHDGNERRAQSYKDLNRNRLRTHNCERKISDITPPGMTHCRPPPIASPPRQCFPFCIEQSDFQCFPACKIAHAIIGLNAQEAGKRIRYWAMLQSRKRDVRCVRVGISQDCRNCSSVSAPAPVILRLCPPRRRWRKSRRAQDSRATRA